MQIKKKKKGNDSMSAWRTLRFGLTCLAAMAVSVFLTSCMSGKQRYKLHKQELATQAKQQRTYKPIEFKGIVKIEASDGIVINVPLEQLRLKDIPNDFKTGTDLLKWAGAMGLTGYAIHSATGDTSSSSVTNNNATPSGE